MEEQEEGKTSSYEEIDEETSVESETGEPMNNSWADDNCDGWNDFTFSLRVP